MCKLLHHFFLSIFLVAAAPGLAQDVSVIEPGIDSVDGSSYQINYQSAFSPFNSLPRITEKKVSDEKVKALKKDDAYWYANREIKKKQEDARNPKQSFVEKGWFNNLLWIIIIVSFVGVVIFYLVSSNVRLFRKQSRKITQEEDEAPTEDIFAINFEREINRAATAKDFRLAVRLWYLRTLKQLSDRNIIDYRHEKTNSDYISALSGGRYYRDFFRLTRNFEYTWYGQFNLSEDGYRFLEKDFSSFQNSLGK